MSWFTMCNLPYPSPLVMVYHVQLTLFCLSWPPCHGLPCATYPILSISLPTCRGLPCATYPILPILALLSWFTMCNLPYPPYPCPHVMIYHVQLTISSLSLPTCQGLPCATYPIPPILPLLIVMVYHVQFNLSFLSWPSCPSWLCATYPILPILSLMSRLTMCNLPYLPYPEIATTFIFAVAAFIICIIPSIFSCIITEGVDILPGSP